MSVDEQNLPVEKEGMETKVESKSDSSATAPISNDANDHTTTPKEQTEANSLTLEKKNEPEKPVAKSPTPYLTGMKLHIVITALYLAVFLVNLDRTIIATAIPKITNEFHSLKDFSWYQSAYQLTAAATQLSYGNVYQLFSVKWTFFGSIVIFEIGSVICGVAPNSIALILGRAVQGFGMSGIYSGTLVITSLCVPIQKRPFIMGVVGALSGIATISGPVLGGVFASKVTWRWCFYINYPLGAITLAIVFFLLETPSSPRSKLPFREKLSKFDFLGTLIFIPTIVCLLLSLEWGGTKYAWSNWRIILLFILFGVLILIFFYTEWKRGELAMLNFRVIRNPVVAWGFWLCFFIGSILFLMSYYMPIYFQAVKNVDATQSGVDYIPTALGSALFSILAGNFVSRFGYANPCLYLSLILTSVGIGLMYNLKVNSLSSYWIGVQVLFGTGIGAGVQQPFVMIQSVLSPADMPIGFSGLVFTQTIGGAIFVTIGQTVFNNKLTSALKTEVPGLDPNFVLSAGASNLTATIEAVNPSYVNGVLESYMKALRGVFLIALVSAVVRVFGTVGMPWIKIKGEGKKKDVKKEAKLEEGNEEKNEKGKASTKTEDKVQG